MISLFLTYSLITEKRPSASSWVEPSLLRRTSVCASNARWLFLTQIGAADRGGQLDLKIARGLIRGLSALRNTATAGPLVGKDQANAKPNARRMECDCEGASEIMVTLACDGC